jgi:ribonuclease T1
VEGNALNDWNKDSRRRREFRLLARDGGLIRLISVLVLGSVFLSAPGTAGARSSASAKADVVRTADLPKEAQETLALIRHGGPFPYARDGAVFANREGRLPPAARGAYREYTVKTPGSRDRGARRIIAAGSDQFWYTADHYRSFRRIIE